jgi:hypothetical protein
MLLLMMGMVNPETCRVFDRVLEIKAKIQLHLVGYIDTYRNTVQGTKNLKKKKRTL